MKPGLTLRCLLLAAVLHPGVSARAGEVPESVARAPVAVKFQTSLGDFVLRLYPDKAPKTVRNFLQYVDEGFYDRTLFHRVIPNFVVQGGGLTEALASKPTHAPVENESNNGLKNLRGSLAMARRSHPDSATSQFFINLKSNPGLDHQGIKPGYTVFGEVSEGRSVIEKLAAVPTQTRGHYADIPREPVVVFSARRMGGKHPADSGAAQARFIAGEHYVVLDPPVPTRDREKVEVLEMFSYGCPHCYELGPLLEQWKRQQHSDVDFWTLPAVWNEAMKLYARAYYVARELKVAGKTHVPLFEAIVVEQKNLRDKQDLMDFFIAQGVARQAFLRAFDSPAVAAQVRSAEERVKHYRPAGAPEIVINGKYRIDRMRAGGLTQMLAVADYLIEKERVQLRE